jgi:hypothetical protein
VQRARTVGVERKARTARDFLGLCEELEAGVHDLAADAVAGEDCDVEGGRHRELELGIRMESR